MTYTCACCNRLFRNGHVKSADDAIICSFCADYCNDYQCVFEKHDPEQLVRPVCDHNNRGCTNCYFYCTPCLNCVSSNYLINNMSFEYYCELTQIEPTEENVDEFIKEQKEIKNQVFEY